MRFAALVALLVACGGARDEEPKPTGGAPELTTTCDAQHDAVGPACVPRFDACPDGQLSRLGGGCERAGADGALDAAACPDGQLADPGSTCAPLSACAAEPADAIFVDGSFVGSGDGTSARPFASIGAAIAAAKPEAKIWIRAGTYAEDLVVDKRLRLEGPCAEKVTIRGLTSAAAIEVHADASLSGISVTGPRRGITIDAADAHLRYVHVHDTGDIGVAARNKGGLLAERVLVERTIEAGIAIAGGGGKLSSVGVRDVKNGDGALNGDGIYVGGDPVTKAPGNLGVSRTLVERVDGGGLATLGATLTATNVVVRKTGSFGIGIPSHVIGTPSSLEIASARVEDTAGPGIVASRTPLLLQQVTVLRARIGVSIFGPNADGEVRLEDVTIDHARHRGLSVVDGAVSLESVAIRHTEVVDGEGSGLLATPSATMKLAPRVRGSRVVVVDNAVGGLVLTSATTDLSRVLVARNGTLGVSVANGVAALREAIVRETRSRADGLRGDGILAAYEPGQTVSLTLVDVLVDANRNIGVAVFGDATMRRTIVRDTTARPGGLYGLGISGIPPLRDPRPSHLTLSEVLVERNVAAGIFLGQSTLDLTSSVVRDTRADPAGAFGDGITLTAGYTDEKSTVVASSTATIARSLVAKNARAGISVIGSNLTLSGSRLQCNAVDLDVEEVFDTETRATHPFAITDRGDNDCSCDPGATRACRAQSNGFLPVNAR